MRNLLGLKPSHPVLIGGSTREGEEEILLSVYKTLLKHFPETVLLIAPRHVARVPRIETMVRQQGLEAQLWTDLARPGAERTAPVVLINTFGELFNLYSVGTILFCGASLVPLGGQNPLEPAVWGNMVFYGPSMEDFAEAKRLLEQERAGLEVTDAETFAEQALYFLSHREELQERGSRARTRSFAFKGLRIGTPRSLPGLCGIPAFLEIPFGNHHDASRRHREHLAVFIGIEPDFGAGRDGVVFVDDGFLDLAAPADHHVVQDHGLVHHGPASNHHVVRQD
jgi:hypothetical protein